MNGKPQVFVPVYRRQGASTLAVADGVRAAIPDQKFEVARRVKAEITRTDAAGRRKVPGAADVRVPQRNDAPYLVLDVNRDKAASVGLSARDAVTQLVTAMNSSIALTRNFWIAPKSGNQYFIAVQYPDDPNFPLADLSSIVATGTNQKDPVRLSSLVTLRDTTRAVEFNLVGLKRIVDVLVNTENRDIGGVAPITIDRLAVVEPYFRADLRARASGPVKAVHHDIRDQVTRGEVLIAIDVPGLVQAEAVVGQREKEWKVSDAKLKDAKAAVLVSAASIQQREADVQAATATRDLKKGRYERFAALAQKNEVVGSVVEEGQRDDLASEAAVTSAKANVERARADFAESESKVEAAEADIELKNAPIEGARKDLEKAKAVADHARVVAPFDGVVVRRGVDPGSFVQNATSGNSEVLISLARVDVVTVAARFPDAFAPLLAPNTPAVVRVDDLPGVTIPAVVTRFAPSVQNADRTMRVEVDLFNGSEVEYRRLAASATTGGPDRGTKGPNDPMPSRAFPTTSAARLIPGMTGTLRLTVGGYGKSFVLRSTAVYSRSGTAYLMLVADGKTRHGPVRVQVSDGKTVRVAMVMKQKQADGNTREVLAELTGDEQVVAARQLELGDGTGVKPSPGEW